ncbi:MAG: hypothetical protein BWK79_12760 [Beggiatoa sp. IS2]|nr:MAG: hypothetical protein BWK79_12760 [Beggiatoa sp. IS2]
MDPYKAEQEQIEDIKAWWRENGTSVVAGILLGIALLYGWQAWQKYTQNKADANSFAYEQLLSSLEQGQIDKARAVAGTLLSEESNTLYAALSALNLARQDLEEGKIDASHAHLQWVLDQKFSPELTHIARLRKARLFIVQEQFDKAQILINGIEVGKFKGSYAVIQGDMALAQGKIDAARTIYTSALASEDLSKEYRDLLQRKVEDLGEQTPPVQARPPTVTIVATPSTIRETVLTVPTSPPAPTPEVSVPLRIPE